MHPALALGIAYLAGSIPSAYLAGRALKGRPPLPGLSAMASFA